MERSEGRITISKAFFKVQTRFCSDCSMALRRFIGGMDGVLSVDAEQGMVAVDFDATRIDEERVRTLTRDSIEKPGYRVQDE